MQAATIVAVEIAGCNDYAKKRSYLRAASAIRGDAKPER